MNVSAVKVISYFMNYWQL